MEKLGFTIIAVSAILALVVSEGLGVELEPRLWYLWGAAGSLIGCWFMLGD